MIGKNKIYFPVTSHQSPVTSHQSLVPSHQLPKLSTHYICLTLRLQIAN
ncbi:MAG: hypothetical protein ACKO2Z_26315 [Sphaerospermopsis kisseleviana]